MPSIIFHLTEAKLITQHLREASADYPFTHIHGWQNDFTIGSILPDAIPRPLKYKTHFWHPSDFTHVVIAPDLNLWQKTYPNTLKEPMLIGYLAHLHLDYLYFTEYLPSIVRFLNEQGLDETESLKAVCPNPSNRGADACDDLFLQRLFLRRLYPDESASY